MSEVLPSRPHCRRHHSTSPWMYSSPLRHRRIRNALQRTPKYDHRDACRHKRPVQMSRVTDSHHPRLRIPAATCRSFGYAADYDRAHSWRNQPRDAPIWEPRTSQGRHTRAHSFRTIWLVYGWLRLSNQRARQIGEYCSARWAAPPWCWVDLVGDQAEDLYLLWRSVSLCHL